MFFKKIKNNKGVDLQLSVVVMMLIFVMAIFMAIDFWMASSSKIILIKELQSAEAYVLVKTLENDYTDLRKINGCKVLEQDFGAYQSKAIERYGHEGGTEETPKVGEIYSRLSDVPYLRTWKVNAVRGLPKPIGEFGIFTDLTYSTKTLLRSPQQIFEVFRGRAEIATSAVKDVNLTVTAKVIPITWNRNGTTTSLSDCCDQFPDLPPCQS